MEKGRAVRPVPKELDHILEWPLLALSVTRGNPEDCGHAHDQVEVADDEIRVVQLNIEDRLRQKRPTQSTRYEQRYESDSE